tara:strand:- start:383 stop:943 length:561 start_codon:yes stop_codon:yes gene_type:complete
MKIYFFGGSFDPPHKAHKLIYKYCLNLCDKFIFFPAKLSPGKEKPKAHFSDRLKMLNLLIDKEDKSKVMIDNFELINNNDKSFTIDTIYYLKEKFKNSSISMVIGYDQYQNLSNWKDYHKILDKVSLICFDRNSKSNKEIKFIDFNHNIDSSSIRALISQNRFNNLNEYLNKDILNYIMKNNLYKS